MWKSLLETAIHAPSPHNVQPWRARIHSDSEADLFIEKRRTLPKEDVTGSFIILTMGLFIEALRILAANRSLGLSHELYSELSNYTPEALDRSAEDMLPFSRLRLTSNGSAPSPYFDELFKTRRTSRISLLPDRIPTEATRALFTLAGEWGQ